jgi:nitrate/TMAO reductase-like tetraheme cytochrome c subunit
MMKWKLAIAFTVLILAVSAVPAADYISAAKCKMCHKLQYESWEGLAHAKAFDRLKPEEQAKEECLGCHATNKSAEMPGVQCEACHGPGSEYKGMKVMKDRDASIAAGLVIPTEATCKGCHEGAPHDQKPFDYATAVEKGVHEHKAPK